VDVIDGLPGEGKHWTGALYSFGTMTANTPRKIKEEGPPTEANLCRTALRVGAMVRKSSKGAL
jgi:hypothetical protein